MHVDFQRVNPKEKIHMKVPLHFINADIAPGVKLSGGIVSHVMTEVDVTCLPKDLPEFIEVDLANLAAGHSIHMSELKLPKGVELVPLTKGDDLAVATITDSARCCGSSSSGSRGRSQGISDSAAACAACKRAASSIQDRHGRALGGLFLSLRDRNMTTGIRLIVGLGNPGREYEATRHNAGFWWVDAVAAGKVRQLQAEKKFHGLAARACRQQSRSLAARTANLHESQRPGGSALASFYKIAPEEILVVHDELDLPPGTVRLKKGGGHGGHNGLKDIIAHLGTPDFWRLRLGIGHPGDECGREFRAACAAARRAGTDRRRRGQKPAGCRNCWRAIFPPPC